MYALSIFRDARHPYELLALRSWTEAKKNFEMPSDWIAESCTILRRGQKSESGQQTTAKIEPVVDGVYRGYVSENHA